MTTLCSSTPTRPSAWSRPTPGPRGGWRLGVRRVGRSRDARRPPSGRSGWRRSSSATRRRRSRTCGARWRSRSDGGLGAARGRGAHVAVVGADAAGDDRRGAGRGRARGAGPGGHGAGADAGAAGADPAAARAASTRRSTGYRRPLDGVPARGRPLWEARLLCNRGVLQVYRGALGAAEADFAARGGAARGRRPGAGRDPGPPQPRLGRGAPRRRPAGAGAGTTASRPSTARTASRWRCCSWTAATCCCPPAWRPKRARTRSPRSPSWRPAGMGSDLAEARLLAAQAELLCGDAAAARAPRRPRRPRLRPPAPPGAGPPLRARSAAAQAAWLEVGSARTARERGDGDGAAPASGSRRGRRRGDGGAAARRRRSGARRGDGAARDGARPRRPAGRAARGRARRRAAGDPGARRRRVGRRGARCAADRRAGRARARAAAARAARSSSSPPRARERGPVQQRTRAWHAAALLRLSRGDRRGASAAVAAGLRALEAHRMTLGATELRAHASGHGEELATLGLRLAVESGSARAGPRGRGAPRARPRCCCAPPARRTTRRSRTSSPSCAASPPRSTSRCATAAPTPRSPAARPRSSAPSAAAPCAPAADAKRGGPL